MPNQDDLYNLGVDSGMVPGDTSEADPNTGDYYNGPQSPPGLPASEAGQLGRPGVMGGTLSPPEPPGAIAGGVMGGTGSFSRGASSGGQGITAQGLRNVDKKDPELNADLAKANAMAEQAGQPMLGAEQTAADEGKVAAKMVAEAGAAKLTAEGHAATLLGGIQDDFAAEEANINAHATAISNQAKADYMASLMDFKASRVDPSQLWHSQSGGAQFGMLVTAFVHDFLGARGIHTSAMDTFNKAVDRNIDAQVQAIRTKGDVTAGFKTLWDMQRAQSASDTEARARVRTFLMEGAKQHIVAHMAQYEAGLATAQGQAAIAKIDGELAKSYVEIYKHIDQNTVALRQQALAKWKAKMQNAQESWHNSILEREAKIKEAAAKGLANADLFADTTKSGGGKARYEINPAFAKDETAKRTVGTQLGALSAFDKKMDRFIELGRQVDAIPTTYGKQLFLTQNQRELLQIQSDLAMHGALAVHGSRFSDTLIKRMEDQFPVNTIFTSDGGVEKMLYNKKAMIHNDAEGAIAGFVHELPADDPRRKLQLAPAPDSVPGQAEYAESVAGANPYKSPKQAQREELEKNLAGPQAMVPIAPDEVGADVRKDHERFRAAYPQFAPKSDLSGSEYARGTGQFSQFKSDAPAGETPKDHMSEFERSLTRLKENVEKDPGDADSLEAIYNQARPFLNHTSAFGANPEMEAQGAYAALMLLDLGYAPSEAKVNSPEKLK